MTFIVEKISGEKGGMLYNSVTKFFKDNSNTIEAEYFYYNGKVNWLLSYGFTSGSLGELRKIKARKVRKPFFSLKRGWFDY